MTEPRPRLKKPHGYRSIQHCVGVPRRQLVFLAERTDSPAASRFGRTVSPGHRVPSTNATGVPFATRSATRSASQFVRRTQPCDSAFETFPGEGVP
jgi:hypothetical protein